MINIEIDGKIYHVEEGDNLLQACLSQGLDLPYFCWHPAMGSVGACRQCAVIQYQDRHDADDSTERDETGRIVMGCMTPVSEGMRISINADSARDFRANIVELLMTNHPHDCPVCEEGGECHLQDMTVMTGHTSRQYTGTKRTHRNQYLGPFISHEMNRCIACYRCVRYYQDYAGGHDLQAMAAHNHVYFGRHENGVLENEFSGNLVEVCPTGVFTDKTLSGRYSRKWDLETAPSLCVHCAQGCNTSPGERYGELRRIVNRYNGEVNSYFLCDRGRFGYGFVNRDDRIKQALQASIQNRTQSEAGNEGDSGLESLTRADTRDVLLNAVADDKKLLGIGSPRASLEANHALRALVGEDNFYSGAGDQQHRLVLQALEIVRTRPVRIPNLKQVEQADAVLVLGEDVLNTAPRLALSLRQAARNEGLKEADAIGVPRWQDAAVREAAQQTRSPVYIASILPTRLDDIAHRTCNGSPDKIARLGFAVAHFIDGTSPQPDGIGEELRALAEQIADSLKSAERPLIVSGTGCFDEAVIQAAANIATALAKAKSGEGKSEYGDLVFCLPEANSMGLAMLTADRPEQNLEGALAQLDVGDIETAIVLENDLSRRMTAGQLSRFFAGSTQIITLDSRLHAAAARSDLVLPAATFDESEGTLVSSEGRAQRYFAVHLPGDDVRASWEWIADMTALRRGRDEPPWQQIDELTRNCAIATPALAEIVAAAPGDEFRLSGMKIARQTHRYSGRTAMRANVKVAEPKQPEDVDSALAFSMEGFPGEKPPAATPYYWSPGWNSNQSVGKFQQEVNGPLKGGDPGIRLLTPAAEAETGYFTTAQATAGADQEGLRLLPVHHIFGSEELSALAPAVGQRSPDAYAVINPADAQRLAVAKGDGIRCAHSAGLEVLIDASVEAGSVCLPVGFAATAGIEFGCCAVVEKDPDWQPRKEPQMIVTDQREQEGRVS